MNNNQRFQTGMQLFEKLHGSHTGKQMVEELKDLCPEFFTMTIEWGFGEIVSRTGIDLKTRELVIIASCISLGHLTAQLRAHMEAALSIGVTQQEIVEVILQMSIYAGFATASNAFRIAKEVFAAQDK